MSNQARLHHRIDELQTQYNLMSEKLTRLRHDVAIENDTAGKFKLEYQIAQAEQERMEVEQELEVLEAQRSTGGSEDGQQAKAFAPGDEHDIFASYAGIDDQPLSGAKIKAKPGLVSTPPAKSQAPAESLDTQILRVLSGYYQQHPGDPEMNIEDVLSALPQHQLPAIQAQLFALKKKGWIGSDLNPEGNAGLVWIEPKGLKIAKVSR